jgi:CubicO group peptidase (beta-lactamase class C family)
MSLLRVSRLAGLSSRVAVLLAAYLSATAAAQSASAGPGALPTARVEAFVQRLMLTNKIPGLQLAVVEHGKVVLLRAYGIANVEDSVPVFNQTVFPVNSITKAFVGVAIMQLVEAGKLDLSAPISRYLDGLPALWRVVTIKQLLTHVSGIPDLWDSHARMVADGEAALMQKLSATPMEFPTGTKYSYNQTNYYLLGRVITKLSGQPFTDFIAERQFRVVGMPHSGFGDSHDVVPHLAATYCYCTETERGTVPADTLHAVLRDWPTYIRTAAGINTTAEELARWLIALQSGVLLKPESLAVLWSPGTLNDGTVKGANDVFNGYAVGWPLVIRPKYRAVASTGGNRAALFIYPESDLAIVLLTNLVIGPERFIDRIASYYLPEMRSSGFGWPPAIQAFRADLLRQGFAKAPDVRKQLEAKDRNFKLSEDELITWAYQLLEEGEDGPSVAIFQLTVARYPKSANAYDSLAEAYEMSGEKQRAIENYTRSLQLDPKNTNAVQHLQSLKGN